MAFKNFSKPSQGRMSNARLGARWLGHAYLFTGHRLEELELARRTLAKTLNCQKPVKTGGGS